MPKVQVGAAANGESQILLKTIRDGAAPVSVLVSFAEVSRASAEDRTRPQLQVTDHADLPRTHVHRLGKRVGFAVTGSVRLALGA